VRIKSRVDVELREWSQRVERSVSTYLEWKEKIKKRIEVELKEWRKSKEQRVSLVFREKREREAYSIDRADNK
jgi:hypothetical protein